MNIEKEIKQAKFSSNVQRAIINIMYTANWLRDNQAAIFREADILPQHFNILRILKGKHPEPVSPGEIRDVMIDKGVDLTRLVDKLVNLELVSRCTCPSNRRKVDITLTQHGLELLKQINPHIEELFKTLSENISEEESMHLSELLDKLRG